MILTILIKLKEIKDNNQSQGNQYLLGTNSVPGSRHRRERLINNYYLSTIWT